MLAKKKRENEWQMIACDAKEKTAMHRQVAGGAQQVQPDAFWEFVARAAGAMEGGWLEVDEGGGTFRSTHKIETVERYTMTIRANG